MHIDKIFKRFGGSPAVITPGYCVGYCELDHRFRLIIRGLMQKGIKPGDRILLMKHSPDNMVASFLAAMWYGAIPGVIPAGVDEEELQRIFTQVKAKIILCDRNSAPLLRGIDLCGAKLLQGIPKSNKGAAIPEYCDFENRQFMVLSRKKYFWPEFSIETGKILLSVCEHEKNETGLRKGDYVVCSTGISDFNVWLTGIMAPLLNGAVSVVTLSWASTELIMQMVKDYKPHSLLLSDSQCRTLLRDIGDHSLRDLLNHSGLRNCFVVDIMPQAFAKTWYKKTGVQLHSCHSELFCHRDKHYLKKQHPTPDTAISLR